MKPKENLIFWAQESNATRERIEEIWESQRNLVNLVVGPSISLFFCLDFCEANFRKSLFTTKNLGHWLHWCFQDCSSVKSHYAILLLQPHFFFMFFYLTRKQRAHAHIALSLPLQVNPTVSRLVTLFGGVLNQIDMKHNKLFWTKFRLSK